MTVSVDPSSAALLEAVGVAPLPGVDPRRRPAAAPTATRRPLLAGTDDARAAAARARRRLPRGRGQARRATARCGSSGFIAASAPAERGVEVVDTTGAGDAFAAGFLASWLLHPEPETALAAGNRLAAQAVTRVGARP